MTYAMKAVDHLYNVVVIDLRFVRSKDDQDILTHFQDIGINAALQSMLLDHKGKLVQGFDDFYGKWTMTSEDFGNALYEQAMMQEFYEEQTKRAKEAKDRINRECAEERGVCRL